MSGPAASDAWPAATASGAFASSRALSWLIAPWITGSAKIRAKMKVR
jgi:hypothetical protein